MFFVTGVETGENSSGRSSFTTEPALSDSDSMNSSLSDGGWLINFQIPWQEFPKPILAACEKGQQPDPLMYNEMRRILVDAIIKSSKNKPTKKDMDAVALKVVSAYPKTFQDTIDGMSLGKGYESLATALYDQSNYILKRRSFYHETDPSSLESLKKTLKKSYGCKISNNDLNSAETDDCQSSKVWLQEEFRKVVQDSKLVRSKMKSTYRLQRKMIAENALVRNLKVDWPFLFKEDFLFAHYDELVDSMQSSKQLHEAMQEGSADILK